MTGQEGRAGDRGPNVPAAWSLTAEEVAERLGVDVGHGLDGAEARQRLERHGPNRLREQRRQGALTILVRQFANLIVGLLVAAALLSAAFGEWLEVGAIIGVVLVNALMGFIAEYRAVRSMEALRELGTVEVRVRRGDDEARLPADELVPGDVVLVAGGDVVAADMRLASASRLQVDESVLTGESVPVEKSPGAVAEDAQVMERSSMLFKGSAATRGSGVAVVVATGMDTELGGIARMVEEAEEEVTPLERRLEELGKRLIWVTLLVAAVTTGAGVLAGRGVFLMVQTGIALAVAAIPEGLPIVATIALARGMWRLSRRNALVNRLSAVETLGATDLILTDKTGTLTENRMTARSLRLSHGTLDLRGDSPGEDGGARHPGLTRALEIGVLCNTARLPAADDEGASGEGGDDDEGVGDPLELALLEVARRAGIERPELVDRMPEERQEAFDASTKMMATFHRIDDGLRVAVKGAAERVAEAADRELVDGDEVELDDDGRCRWLEINEEMAAGGLRVLALAERRVDSVDADPYEGLTLVGLMGLRDPAREEVRSALQACSEAGIRVVMVTGDQPATARAIADELGMLEEGREETGKGDAGKKEIGTGKGGAGEKETGTGEGPAGEGPAGEEQAGEGEAGEAQAGEPQTVVATGAEVGRVAEQSPEVRERLRRVAIFARVDPEQKLELIALHQEAGSVVAMTGDGVNDAPALKKADIGIAMGKRGTQVAKDAADMVLLDDHFSSIVAAVRQGRVIFGNIRKFVVYLLSCNMSEILVVGSAAAVNLPLPILPLQILFLNLVTDVFPALALALGEGDPRVMERPPRDPDEGIVDRRQWAMVVGFGATITVAVLAALIIAQRWLGMPEEQAVTVSFLTLAVAQLFHVFNVRDRGSSFVHNDVVRNPWVWGALVLCAGLLAGAVYVPWAALVLETVDPGLEGWALVVGMSLVPWAAGQLRASASKGP